MEACSSLCGQEQMRQTQARDTVNRDRVMAPAVKMVTELAVERLTSCDGCSCSGRGLCFIPTKVTSAGQPSLCPL
ncbi:hypothetical protein PBY51_009292 [Eleginops maclovinus]|uniref:Uncharacterized protein n=1 Tax=Eleginops maclovinus TaxID=56733 RepID=A0AAN7XQS0_ELEMC|nr:hypothetical protein PBY51_009292 [Eleginops maclovinus]